VVLRMSEPQECWHWTREKLKRRGQKAPVAETVES